MSEFQIIRCSVGSRSAGIIAEGSSVMHFHVQVIKPASSMERIDASIYPGALPTLGNYSVCGASGASAIFASTAAITAPLIPARMSSSRESAMVAVRFERSQTP